MRIHLNPATSLVYLIGALCLGALGVNASSTAPAMASPAAVIPGDGTYRIGTDVLPGTYITQGGQGDHTCTWSRHGAMGFMATDIIDSGASRGLQVVTIAPTDATFETTFCQIWTPEGASPDSRPASQATQTPGDLPGLQHATIGQSCTNTMTFVFAVGPEGQTLACLPSTPPTYGLSAPVVGVRPLCAPCTEVSQLGQSTDGEPMMCLGTPASWIVYRDY